MKTLIIAGSPSIESRSTQLLKHIGKILGLSGFKVEVLQLRTLEPHAILFADYDDPGLKIAIEKIKNADLIVIGTPVYKASYSGLLKAFLDVLPQDGLRDKTIFPVATGGSAAHTLAIDYALRPVLNSMSAWRILPGLFVTDSQTSFSNSGQIAVSPEISSRLKNILVEIQLQFNQIEYPTKNPNKTVTKIY